MVASCLKKTLISLTKQSYSRRGIYSCLFGRTRGHPCKMTQESDVGANNNKRSMQLLVCVMFKLTVETNLLNSLSVLKFD